MDKKSSMQLLLVNPRKMKRVEKDDEQTEMLIITFVSESTVRIVFFIDLEKCAFLSL